MPLLRSTRFRVLALMVGVLVLGLAAASASAASPPPGGYSPAFRVGGEVEHPRTYDLAALEALPAHTVTVTFVGPNGPEAHTFTGARLDDVATAASPRFKPNVKNDRLRWTARVHATDDYEVVVAWGEFDPGYEGKEILLAYEDGGQLLTQAGMARLVVPGDLHGGRYVDNVNAVAFEPPHPVADRFDFLRRDDQ